MKSSSTQSKDKKLTLELDSSSIVQRSRSREMFFGVVGPVGAGGSRVIESLIRACEQSGYKCEYIKASKLIKEWAVKNKIKVPDKSNKSIDAVVEYQNLGDQMRVSDRSAIARAAAKDIARRRAEAKGEQYTEGKAVHPGDEKRAYLIESIRHPSEVSLLRGIYGSAFALIGVVCEESQREKRILGKYFTDPERREEVSKQKVKDFMRRDSDDPFNPHGQHVEKAFFDADYFVDNSVNDPNDGKRILDGSLARLISIINHDKIIRPNIDETAMHHAHSACIRSACLSRQVGAALVGKDGTIISTGVNEVPKAGGGVYGEDGLNNNAANDHRCAFRSLEGLRPYCSNNREQNKIIDELIKTIPELSGTGDLDDLRSRIRQTRLGQLIEFSRAVHAEMDALLSAGREGLSTVGTRLFVTTFPCHYCARHIVSSGVAEVQFIEPYPKSLALQLHNDSIETISATSTQFFESEKAESEKNHGNEDDKLNAKEGEHLRVLFHSFVGVAPRLYTRAFQKRGDLKDRVTGEMKFEETNLVDDWSPYTKAYPELEAELPSLR